MRATLHALAALLLTAVFAVVTNGGPASAATLSCTGPEPSVFSRQDLDGDGFSDVVVGVPNATIAGHADAGAVDIHYWK